MYAGKRTGKDKPPPFGNLNDPQGYQMYVPSSQYITDVFLAAAEKERPLMEAWMSTLGGLWLKIDHTFKVCKVVNDASGMRAYQAVLTVMNEYCQVLAQFCTQTKTFAEVEQQLKTLIENYKKLKEEVSKQCCVMSVVVGTLL